MAADALAADALAPSNSTSPTAMVLTKQDKRVNMFTSAP